MTGYGRVEEEFDDYVVSAEVRTVNSRYLDINFRLPEVLSRHESVFKKLIQHHVERGQVSVKVSVNGDGQKWSDLSVNRELLQAYHRLFEDIQNELSLNAGPTLSDYLQLNDIIIYEQDIPDDSRLIDRVKQTLEKAIGEVVHMRKSEGESLVEDISDRLGWLEESIDRIEEKAAENSRTMKEVLERRVDDLLDEVPVDRDRLSQEIAYTADKIDITEETVRLRSHVQQFHTLLEKEGSVGKKLNFLLQEMNREVNTIGAKSNNAEISHIVVDSKNEIEKLREQVQNVE